MEKKLISALLTNNDNIKHFYGKVTPEMLTDPLCKDIYTYYLQSYQLGLEVTVIDIQQNLESEMFTKAEIGKFLKEILTEYTLTEAEQKSLAKSIVNTHKAKEFYKLCSTASYKPKDIHNTLVEVSRRAEEMLKDEKPRGTTLSKIAERYGDYYGHEHDTGLRTGLYEVDDILVGLLGGDVTVLAARPGVGKSALSTQILETVASKGKRVGYFNLEMKEQQLFERMVARKSGISLTRIKKAISFMPEEQEAYSKAIVELKGKKNLVIFSGSFTATEIKTNCKNQNFDLIVVDYLQIVKPDRYSGSRVSDVGDISKAIKELSMTENVPVIALSQLNRRIGPMDEPTMADLRESGDIEQDASNILLMWNLDKDGRYKGLKIDKNRQGVPGTVPLEFKGSTMSFDTINHKTIDQIKKECGNVSASNKRIDPYG